MEKSATEEPTRRDWVSIVVTVVTGLIGTRLVASAYNSITAYSERPYVQILIEPDYKNVQRASFLMSNTGGINRQAPNLIFIDLDLSRFKSNEALNRALNKTCKNISERLNNAYSTVLWSGNGYHILQPIGAFVLESERVFASFQNPSMKFLRFASHTCLSHQPKEQCLFVLDIPPFLVQLDV